jgi:hypothetical protein
VDLLRLFEFAGFRIRLAQAPEVLGRLEAEILSDTRSIRSSDYAHLPDAYIRVMWASASFAKQGRMVLGQAEQIAFRARAWQKAGWNSRCSTSSAHARFHYHAPNPAELQSRAGIRSAAD